MTVELFVVDKRDQDKDFLAKFCEKKTEKIVHGSTNHTVESKFRRFTAKEIIPVFYVKKTVMMTRS